MLQEKLKQELYFSNPNFNKNKSVFTETLEKHLANISSLAATALNANIL